MRKPIHKILLLLSISILNSPCVNSENELSFEQLMLRGKDAAAKFAYEDAARWYSLALEQKPNDANVHYLLAMQYIGLEQLDDAEQSLLRAVELNPQFTSALTNLGILSHQFNNEFSRAETYYQRAIDSEPGAVDPRRLLGEMYLSLGKHKKALAVFQQLIKTAPASHSGYLGAGQALLRSGDADAAIHHLLDAARRAPKQPEPFRALAQALARVGKTDKAKEMRRRFQALQKAKINLADLKRQVRREPNNAQHWFHLGEELVKQKDADEAIKALESGLAIQPNALEARSLVGAMYLMNQQPQAALSHLDLAAKAQPHDANLQNQLGVCYLMTERYSQAAIHFERALALGGDNPGIEKNLDIALRKSRQTKP